MHRFFFGVLLALNQLANAATGGSPHETVSARLGDAREHGSRFARAACAVLEQVNTGKPQYPDHCTEARANHERYLREALEQLR